MVGLREVPRTATFTWSPGTSIPLLATGTKAGAVDEGFSNETQLELWDLDLNNVRQSQEPGPVGTVSTDSRFNDIAWTKRGDESSRGIIAGALENGSLGLWDADKLLSGSGDASMSPTSQETKHNGAIKALQFNASRSDLLATAGAKGELFISDLNNIGSPLRIGNAVARADDFDCLDWNKRTAHILATGSNGGTFTVWDVKNKRESLTQPNMGRKSVSAIAWDPIKSTRLITASASEPVILVWDLRNANTPEKILRGHDGGVLSLSWCQQDTDLLLSCGKDNRNICWNPQTGESVGEFPVVSNWTFQTRWNPHNPSLLATASFDGKIAVQTIQNTKPEADGALNGQSQTLDDEEFFSKAQTQPQGPKFTLKKAPKWLQRPCGASFGFGGKVVTYKSGGSETQRRSIVHISTFAVDDSIVSSTKSFESALKKKDLTSICEDRIVNAPNETEKADWRIIKTLASKEPRKDLVEYLGFSSERDEAADRLSKLSINGAKAKDSEKLENPSAPKHNRLSSFFDNVDGDNFLSELVTSKSAKINDPFQLYTGSESEADRQITRALILGEFERALDVCVQEERMSDAFMIAICGGQHCIEKARKAYFDRKTGGPNYLRLLASVASKNLWDLVHNADLANWKEVMATLCTYADDKEFSDLCEVLGDRIEEQFGTQEPTNDSRKDASFCYLAGSKLEKAVAIWINELKDGEQASIQTEGKDSSFSVHARSLQNFIEKVTVFREVTKYEDSDRNATSEWKLAPLYDKYTEYADIASAHGQLQVAERYLDFLPNRYPAAEVAKSRVKQATGKAAAPATQKQQTASTGRTPQRAQQPDFLQEQVQQQVQQQQKGSAARQVPGTGVANPYASPPGGAAQNPYAPVNGNNYGASSYNPNTGYQDGYRQGNVPPKPAAAPSASSIGPPPRNVDASSSVPPPSKATNQNNWNDTPEDFFKAPNSRRGTPAAGGNIPSSYQPVQQQATGPSFAAPPRSTPPLGPPPKGSAPPPPRMNSPSLNNAQQSIKPTAAANPYAPAPSSSNLPVQQQPSVPRGPSPYNAPPSGPPPSNRYAPAQPAQAPSQPEPHSTGGPRPAPPQANPYAPQQSYGMPQQNGSEQPLLSTGPPPGRGGTPTGLPQIPLQTQPQQESRPSTSQSQRKSTPKYPRGDRSHIPSNAQPIVDILSHDMQRVKAQAPANFKAHVMDAEKRLNLLFDHLNNEDLLKQDTVESMVELAQAMRDKEYEQASAIHIDLVTNKTEECGNWMVGVKRLIAMSKATP